MNIDKQNNDRIELLRFIFFWIPVCVIFVLMYILGFAQIKKYKLADPDCYMRLVRVTDLYNNGCWYDPVNLRSNAPYGNSSHWTRPFDVLLLTGALPIALFTDFKTALFWWGVMISPILLFATLIAFRWSTRPLLSKDGPFLACLIFVSQFMVIWYYQAGQSDHHSFINFVLVLSIGFTLRMILKPFNSHLCYTAGAVGAFSMWISVESMVPVGITLGMLGLLWILENGDFLDKSLCYASALFIATGFSLVLERAWYSLLAEEYDRLSIVHFSIFGFVALLWITIFLLNRHRQFFRHQVKRLLFITVGGTTVALAIFVCFPKFYKGPFADVNNRMILLWFSKIGDLKPLLSRLDLLPLSVQLIGSAIVCFAFLFYLLFKSSYDENWKGWLFISLSSVVYILLSLNQIRWSIYAQTLLVIPITALMVLLRQMGPKTGFLRTLKNVSIVLIFSLGFLLIGLMADVIFKKGDSEKKRDEVSLMRMCEYLTDSEKWPERSFRILTHIYLGAEILYRTQHEVVATGYHRNVLGTLDTYDVLTADTDEQALEIIQKRGIDLILLRLTSTESIFYSKPGQTSTFYKRLCDDTIPNWLRKVELPSGLSSSFFLFETIE